MKRILPLFTTLTGALGLIRMLCLYPAANIKAEVPVEAFGVWDLTGFRGEKMAFLYQPTWHRA